MQSISCEMPDWMKHNLESRLPEGISITLDMQRTSPLRQKEKSEKASLKLNIQKTKIMASNPITSWKTEGEKVETMKDFIFLGSKITADGNCSYEIKRCLLLGRKVMQT